jgi:hypothetical protein
MEQIRAFIQQNPVRVAAAVSSIVALVVSAVAPDVPVEMAVLVALSALGLGEYAQRAENKKTDEALHTPVPKKKAAKKAK